MDLHDVRNLYAYNRWAAERLYAKLETLSPEQFTATIASSFPSIRETLFHILAAEWIWMKRWTGESPRATAPNPNVSLKSWDGLRSGPVPTVEELSTLAQLHGFGEDVDRKRETFLATVSEDALQAPLPFSDMAGAPHAEPLVQMLQHVVNHGSYHRGQIVTMLRQLGASTPSLDMLYFYRERNQQTKAAGQAKP